MGKLLLVKKAQWEPLLKKWMKLGVEGGREEALLKNTKHLSWDKNISIFNKVENMCEGVNPMVE